MPQQPPDLAIRTSIDVCATVSESLGRARTDRPPGRPLDPRRLISVPARLSPFHVLTRSNGSTSGADDAESRIS